MVTTIPALPLRLRTAKMIPTAHQKQRKKSVIICEGSKREESLWITCNEDQTNNSNNNGNDDRNQEDPWVHNGRDCTASSGRAVGGAGNARVGGGAPVAVGGGGYKTTTTTEIERRSQANNEFKKSLTAVSQVVQAVGIVARGIAEAVAQVRLRAQATRGQTVTKIIFAGSSVAARVTIAISKITGTAKASTRNEVSV